MNRSQIFGQHSAWYFAAATITRSGLDQSDKSLDCVRRSAPPLDARRPAHQAAGVFRGWCRPRCNSDAGCTVHGRSFDSCRCNHRHPGPVCCDTRASATRFSQCPRTNCRGACRWTRGDCTLGKPVRVPVRTGSHRAPHCGGSCYDSGAAGLPGEWVIHVLVFPRANRSGFAFLARPLAGTYI
jgi:hypothetical protein